MHSGIYMIENLVNGKKYIGQSVEIEKRWKKEKYGQANEYLLRAFEKYGIDNFSFTILEEIDRKRKDLLDEREIFYIAKFNTNDENFGYNLTEGGGGGTGYKFTQEQREALSKALQGHKISEETRQKISESLSGEKSVWFGKKHEETSKEKIRQALQGHEVSKETRQKLRTANLGKKASEEARRKMSESRKGEKNYMYGKPMYPHVKEALLRANLGRALSDEHKKKLRENHADTSGEKNGMFGLHLRWFNNGKENVRALECPEGFKLGRLNVNWTGNNERKAMCVETGIIYESMTLAAKTIERTVGAIQKCCKGKTKTAGGYHWRYIEE